MGCSQSAAYHGKEVGGLSFGKMRSFIYITSNTPTTDAQGFTTKDETIIASTRAYKEERHGNESWKNRAAFSTATDLFRFRKIPNLTITPAMGIICSDERYNILNVEDVRSRGMYVEVLASLVQPSGGSHGKSICKTTR